MTPADHRRDQYRWWMQISSRWADCDAYGHVNNAIYYNWFDTAVTTMLIERGVLRSTHANTIGLCVSSGCDFLAPIEFPAKRSMRASASGAWAIAASALKWRCSPSAKMRLRPWAISSMSMSTRSRAARCRSMRCINRRWRTLLLANERTSPTWPPDMAAYRGG